MNQISTVMRVQALFAVLMFFSVTTLFAVGPPSDPDNPADLYGADGLAFTCDDILIPRGGYTNTAVFAMAYGEPVNGNPGNTDPEKLFNVAIGSWNPEEGSVAVYVILRDDDPEDPGGPRWRYAPMEKQGGWDSDRIYEDEYFGVVESVCGIPDEMTASTGGGDFRTSDWWNNGNLQRVSGMSLSTWQLDGSNSGGDPAVSLSPEHFPPVAERIKDIKAENVHFRVICLSTMNLETGSSGVTMFGDVKVKGLEVEVDADEGGIEIQGIVNNASPSVDVEISLDALLFEIDLVTIQVVIDGSSDEPPDSIIDGIQEIMDNGNKVIIGACYIIDEIRASIEPSPGPLTTADKDRIRREFDDGRGIDCLANEVVRALMYSGTWLEWIGTDDAAILVNEKEAPTGEQAVDLSGTALDTNSSSFNISSKYLTEADTPHVTTNWGLDSIMTDCLLYGRDATHKYSRLVEWYASNWLCMNLTDFQPYNCSGQPFEQGEAEWNYYDLICEKQITNGDGTDGAIVLDKAWPPSSHWFGGQGMILGAQGAVGHDGAATAGKPKPTPSDNVFPGSPLQVFAGLVALSPYAIDEGGGSYLATYNVRGITLSTSTGYELDYDEDCNACDWKLPWPPINDDPSAALKFFHANVANGHDDTVSSGKFHCMWDFNGDGQGDLTYGNASYNPGGSSFGRLFVYDLNNGRTGVHYADIWY